VLPSANFTYIKVKYAQPLSELKKYYHNKELYDYAKLKGYFIPDKHVFAGLNLEMLNKDFFKISPQFTLVSC
jgi:hypothetical protein